MHENEKAVPPDDAEFETRAADGRKRYPAAHTLTDLVFMLQDGAFNQDAGDKLAKFAATMEHLGCDSGKMVKGKITLAIEVNREADGIYFFTPLLTTKLPPEKGQRTIAWVDRDNHFTPNQPGQANLFGTVREVKAEPRAVRMV
jgi:hypothetical protein